MSDSSEILNNAWRDERVPLLNGLMFPDGERTEVNWTGNRIVIGQQSRWDLLDLDDEWTYFTELCRVAVPNGKLLVIAGEGGLGTDGVIALVDASDNSLRWLLFMDSSNPFSHVDIVNGRINAKTTLDTTWTLDLTQPGFIAVSNGLLKA